MFNALLSGGRQFGARFATNTTRTSPARSQPTSIPARPLLNQRELANLLRQPNRPEVDRRAFGRVSFELFSVKIGRNLGKNWAK